MSMRFIKKYPALLCAALSAAAFAGNPILKNSDPDFLYAADPAAEVFNGKVYVYCSHDQDDATGYSTMQDYVILESSDMTNWVNHGVVLEPRTAEGFEYASGQMNAPDCAYKDGWYYWYFPYEKTYVGVAKSENPTGPWESAVTTNITVIFDPTVFVDDDGQAYIYGTDTKSGMGDSGVQIFGAKLKDNMIELDGDWHQLCSESVAEGATIFKRDGIYYFMARQGWDETAYWMADNPLPYPGNTNNLSTPVYSDSSGYASYQGLITDSDDHAVTAPAHMSAVEFNDQWWFFYHRGDVNDGSNSRRSACVDKMEFNEDGTIQRIVYTLEDEEETVVSDGSMHQEAEAFSDSDGIIVEACSDDGDGEQVAYVSDGDWTAYTNIYFGENAAASITFYFRASSQNSGGDIELRTGSETGAVAGVVSISGTGSWTSYETFAGTVSGVSGTNDLYCTYSGGDGNLMNVNWFEWTPSSNLVNQSSELPAEWTFDNQTLENIGTAGSVHDGSLSNGTAVFSSDTYSGSGYSLDLSSGSPFMQVNNSASGDAAYADTFDSDSFTCSMWVKHDGGSWAQWSEFGGKGSESAHEGWALRCRYYTDGDSRNGTRADFYKASDDTAIDGEPFVDITDETWHLLTVTFDHASSNLNLYVDGGLEGSASNAFMNSASGRALVFGARDDGTRGESILIDNIQFYDYALSAAEVEVLFSGEDTEQYAAEFISAAAAFSNGQFFAQFTGTTGEHYRLEYIEDLDSTNGWQAVTDLVSLAESPAGVSAAAANETGFYRIIWMP